MFGVARTTPILNSFLLQRKALRIICCKGNRESTETIFTELNILQFTHINAYLTCRFMYKCYTENEPGIFSDFVQCNSAVHGYSTRQSERLHVSLKRSNPSQLFICYHGVVVWNAILNSKINPDTFEFVFAKVLKAWIFDGNLTL